MILKVGSRQGQGPLPARLIEKTPSSTSNEYVEDYPITFLVPLIKILPTGAVLNEKSDQNSMLKGTVTAL